MSEKGRKTKAPHALERLGKAIPITKLQDQEAKLPIDMATGLGATSKSSARKIHKTNKNKFITNKMEKAKKKNHIIN